jgi:hypothetical protein
MSESADVFAQDGYARRFSWGRGGARDAVQRGDVVVLVDVLLPECASGRELCALGYLDEAMFCAQLDVDAGPAPQLQDRAYRPHETTRVCGRSP